MPNCDRSCGDCKHCVSAHAQLVIDEKDAEIAKLKNLISDALSFMKARHEWKPTAPHADMIWALEAAIAENPKADCPEGGKHNYEPWPSDTCCKCQRPRVPVKLKSEKDGFTTADGTSGMENW